MVVELYGDYWHCNPEKYKEDYYHSQLHMTARAKWEQDSLRLEKITELGYNTQIVWEKSIRDGTFFKSEDYLLKTT